MEGGLVLGRGVVLAGRYQLEEALGQGGMGEVWRGLDQRLNRPIAIKVLPAHLAADRSAVARFRREAEITAGLQHPGITVLFDIEEHERLLFLVMELLHGRDLSRVLAGNPGGLPIEQVVALGTQIADALAAAHSRGVVHRDIKPANLFLQNDDRVKICDFGIARLSDATEITGTGVSIGTPRYMAPEQFQGGAVDARTDLYSFGCVLHELLTGRTPFSGGSGVAAAMYQHVNEAPAGPRSIRPDVPPALNRLVLDLLEKDPADRPADVSTVGRRLGEAGAGTGDPAGTDIRLAPTLPPEPRPEPAEPADAPQRPAAVQGSPDATRSDAPASRRRRTGPIALVAGAVVVALAGAGTWLLMDHGGRKAGAGPTGGPSATTGPVTAPAVPGWRLVRSEHHGIAYDVPPGWHVETPDTQTGYGDANGNVSQLMRAVADIRHPGCTGANLEYFAQTGATGGKGVVRSPSSAQWPTLVSTATLQASQWATGEYTTGKGRVPSVDVGDARTVTPNGIKAVDVAATATVRGARTRCEPPRGIVHAVAIAAAQGGPIVFIAVADRQVTRQASDADLARIIGSIRPLG